MKEKLNKFRFEDERLICCDCGQPFTFSVGEHSYFWSKGLSVPKRCPRCRKLRRETLIPDLEVGND